MTIRKFGAYGTSTSRPSNLVVLQSDLDIAQRFTSLDRTTPCTVRNGSIAQALGITQTPGINPDALNRGSQIDEQMTRVEIDLMQIEYSTDTTGYSKSSLIVAGTLAVQHRTAFSISLILSNSGIFRERDVLPRAHPNDGYLDVLEIGPKITLRQRSLAWRRSRTGSHLPHPHLQVSRSSEYQWSGRPSKIVADGVTYRGVVWFQCKVLADAMTLYF
jgi:hypothetical protein